MKRVHPEIEITDVSGKQSSRRPFLPFDQISHNEPVRPRNRTILQKFLPNITNQLSRHKARQKQRLAILSKINDKSYCEVSLRKSLIQLMNTTIDSRFRVFRPNDKFILFWNFLIFIAITINFIQIPLSLLLTEQVYQCQYNVPFLLGLNILFIFILFIDIFIIRLNLAFYRHGKLITSRVQIFVHYTKFNFWLDVFSWLSLLIYLSSNQPEVIYLKFLFYLRFATLSNVNQQIQNSLSLHRIRFCLFKLFKVIMLLWFTTTWVSCIYFAIDYSFYRQKGYYYNTGQLWLTNSNAIDNINLIQSYPFWYIWYEYAAYWSLQTSAGIGYGNMTPRNPHQVLYCNFIILSNTIFFAYFINTIWQIISQLQQNKDNYTENLSMFSQYIKNCNISQQLNMKLGNYMQSLWKIQNQEQNEQQLSTILSADLYSELHVGIYCKIFDNIPFFLQIQGYSTQWNQLMKKLLFFVHKEKIGSGENIYEFGEVDNALYYLVIGKVGIYVESLQIGGEFHMKQHFGIQQYVNKGRRLSSVATLSFCVYWKILQPQLKSCIKQFPILFEKYCQQKQRVNLYGQVNLLNSKCLKCLSTDHIFINCPQLNNWRKKFVRAAYVRKQLNRQQNNERKLYQRLGNKNRKVVRLGLINTEEKFQTVYHFKGYRNLYNI